MYPEYFEITSLARLVAGPGTMDSLGELIEPMGGKRALIVSDKDLKKIGMVDKVIAGLQGTSIEVAGIFDDIVVNSEYGVVENGAEFAKNSGADFLIAIGGGSVIDTAKAMNIVWSLGGKLEDYEGLGTIDRKLKPLVVIPTTAGTGSEATQYAVIKNNALHYKAIFASPFLLPDVSILDPLLTIGLPPILTASTGMDSMVHAIESCTSTNSNPISDAFAHSAIKLLTENIVTATKNGSDINARYGMLMGSTLAGKACNNALLGSVHAISHTLGGVVGVPHGIANSMLLPYCMEYNMDAVADSYAGVARAMGIDTKGLSDLEAGQKAVEKVRELLNECGLPIKLSQVGVTEDVLQEVAEGSAIDGSMACNAKEMEPEVIYELLKKMF